VDGENSANDDHVGRLSGGMKQKLGLACTLVHPPRFLLLDEPTVGVDPVSRRELWEIVSRFMREEGTTVLLSTAYLDEAERCDEVLMLHAGRLLGQGAPHQFSEPLTGRTYRVHVEGMKHRALQQRLAARTEVMDAVVERSAVRIVLGRGADATAGAVAFWVPGSVAEQVPPRFEDAFVAMLRGVVEQRLPSAKRVQNGVAGRSVARDGPSRAAIEVRQLEKRFGTFTAVHRISFAVAPGEIFGLLGANGAGKTTTFRMLCGLLPPTAGTLRVAGVDVRRTAAAARARIGYMAQKFSLYGSLSVAQNLRFFRSAYGLRGTRQKSRMQWATDEFELGSVSDENSGFLSLGFQQRLALACALMHEPDILFLDEPTSGVDPLARREFWQRINQLALAVVTILVTTHFMEKAEYCDRLAIMVAGEVLAEGTPDGIKDACPHLGQSATDHGRCLHRSDRVGSQPHKGRVMDAPATHQPSTSRPRPSRRGGAGMRLRGLMRKEFFQVMRDPSSLGIAFVLPVTLLLLFGYGVSLDAKHIPRSRWSSSTRPPTRPVSVGRSRVPVTFGPYTRSTCGPRKHGSCSGRWMRSYTSDPISANSSAAAAGHASNWWSTASTRTRPAWWKATCGACGPLGSCNMGGTRRLGWQCRSRWCRGSGSTPICGAAIFSCRA